MKKNKDKNNAEIEVESFIFDYKFSCSSMIGPTGGAKLSLFAYIVLGMKFPPGVERTRPEFSRPLELRHKSHGFSVSKMGIGRANSASVRGQARLDANSSLTYRTKRTRDVFF